jgi:hypothetical protein
MAPGVPKNFDEVRKSLGLVFGGVVTVVKVFCPYT